MSLIDLGIKRSRTVVMLLILLLYTGGLAYRDISKESAPDVAIPVIYVSTSLKGISPLDAERLLIKPIEKAVARVEGIKELSSTGYLGGGNVVLEFDAGFDVDQALQDVREEVDRAKGELPVDADEPSISEVNVSLFPVMQISLSGDIDEKLLLSHTKILSEAIETIPQVLSADIDGERDEVVELIINPEKLQSYKITPTQIISAVNSSNLLVAAGNLEGESGRFSVKVPGLIENFEDINQFPIISVGESVVTLSDIADIKRKLKDVTTYSRLNGKSAFTISVVKRTGENIIQTSENARAIVTEITQNWSPEIKIDITQDEAKNIKNSLVSLQNSVISAVILVMIVILATLGLRPSLLVGISIPGSFLSGIMALHIMGITLNFVVLFGLVMSVGLLVDGAIVVVEYAERKIEEGFEVVEAFRLASKKMAWPIIASTGTTLAAFMPLLFWPGIVGEFMGYLPLTVIFILTSSLIMALFFMPILGGCFGITLRYLVAFLGGIVLSSLFSGISGLISPILGFVGQVLGMLYGAVKSYQTIGLWVQERIDNESVVLKDKKIVDSKEGLVDLQKLGQFTQNYIALLENWALKKPGRIIGYGVLAMVVSWVMYAALGRGVEFFPQGDSERGILLIHATGNYSIAERNDLVWQVEQEILEFQKETGEIKSITSNAGDLGSSNNRADDVIGVLNLEYVNWRSRRVSQQILKDINQRIQNIAGIYVEAQEQQNGPPTGKPINIEFSGSSFEDLITATHIVHRYLEKLPGIRDLENSLSSPGIEWQLNVNREEAYKYNININTIGNYIRMVTNGIKVSSYRPNDSNDEIDIILRLPTELRSIEQLDQIRINTPEGDIPMSNFVTREAVVKTPQIRRLEQKRISFVKSDLEKGVLARKQLRIIQKAIPTLDLPKTVKVIYRGENQDQAEASAFLSKAFGVALSVMALILLTQFNSFYQCVLILSAVIMSTLGVMLGLLIIRQPFGIIMSGIGIISLAGIVVNNNIVLIDTFNDLMKRSAGNVRQSIIQACAQRLRPVLMTTATTMLGLVPLVVRVEIDFVNRGYAIDDPSTAFWQQLSAAIVFGLGFATVLTLIVTPCGLLLFNNMFAKQKLAQNAKMKLKKATL